MESTTTPKQESLRREFYRLDAELLRALNGIGCPKASEDELRMLRTALLNARHECIENGVQVETLWEAVSQWRKEDEASVRQYAETQLQMVPMVSPRRRKGIAWLISIVACAFALTTLGSPVWSLAALGGTYLVVWGLLHDCFPTPAVRIARRACDLRVDVADIWKNDSEGLYDYNSAYKMHRLRMSRCGDGVWLKAR